MCLCFLIWVGGDGSYRGCNAGYYKRVASGTLSDQCLSCAATAGTFMNASGDLTACYSCTNRGDANGYYLKPVVGGFDGRTNACPW